MARCGWGECGAIFHVCRRCDRGQRYCSSACRVAARGRCLREARQRHQQSREGRQDHADRQRDYRARMRSVTEHGPRNLPTNSKVCARADMDAAAKEHEHAEAVDGRIAGSGSDPRDRAARQRNDSEGASRQRPKPPLRAAMAARSGGSVAGDGGPRCAFCGQWGRWSRRELFIGAGSPTSAVRCTASSGARGSALAAAAVIDLAFAVTSATSNRCTSTK